ncbi:DNA-processing protein DprA [Labilibaculum euxinus]|uniref:DNA-protecting protein DprA n=1 Tax=Labilibaculum euxinus TaxID=2686357 RepID=A0A7M4D9G8_9BACT|nr:DNA-processing protein DprA [Labilibaculum euxinus]MUP39297.1 DNA-protecting protein DprA [Labilibaculum euxinus]MVB08502.1 DNA-protecting protein DprA [Labilibaculum euxinus]
MEDVYKIAVSFLNGIGPVNTKKVIAYTGSIEGLFKEKKQNLLKIPGIGQSFIDKLDRDNAIQLAEEEQKFISDNHINVSFYLEKDYPQRLLNCADSPCTLYYKGNTDFNVARTISIVGTRNASDYGREICNKLIQDLSGKEIKPLIISGLAYGVDICAHKAALRNQLQTVAAIGHGLHMMYPSQHKRYAEEIVNQGALISEFTSKSKFDPKNFVRRNRIIAGMADATIVIESASKGGSLVTADIANSYNRDVFAFPGRTSDKGSTGCNKLIKTNQAHLIESVADLEYILGWENKNKSPKMVQTKLFIELSPEEESLVQVLKEKGNMPIDSISLKTSFPMSKVSSLLLKLEFEGIIKSLPGKIYTLNT